jgi:hypothetical protein
MMQSAIDDQFKPDVWYIDKRRQKKCGPNRIFHIRKSNPELLGMQHQKVASICRLASNNQVVDKVSIDRLRFFKLRSLSEILFRRHPKI